MFFSAGGISCDFENEYICGYKALVGMPDDFQWLRFSGGTLSSNTGPLHDLTKGNSNGNFAQRHKPEPKPFME